MDAESMLHGLSLEQLEQWRPDLVDQIERRAFTAGCAKTLRDALCTSRRRIEERLRQIEGEGRVRHVAVVVDQGVETADPMPCGASEGER